MTKTKICLNFQNVSAKGAAYIPSTLCDEWVLRSDEIKFDFLVYNPQFIAYYNVKNYNMDLKELIALMPESENGIKMVSKFWNEQWEKKFRETPQFKDVETFVIAELPVFLSIEEIGKPLSVERIVLSEEVRFKGAVYLHSFELSPPLYGSYSDLLTQVFEKKALVTPVLYNPEDFTPSQNIILNLNLEIPEEQRHISLMRQLLDVLDDMPKYSATGTRHIMMRGVFECQERESESHTPLAV